MGRRILRLAAEMEMVLRNFGHGPAHNIRWEITADEEELKKRGVNISEVALFRGLSYLAPSEEIRFFFGSAPELLREPPLKPFQITATYENAAGRERRASFLL